MKPLRSNERGMALVLVLLLLVIFMALGIGLLVGAGTERVVAVNERDHAVALTYAEAGLSWAHRGLKNIADNSVALKGPNAGSASDDHMLGLRSLGLTATNQLNTSNEATASAIVPRSFASLGSLNYEALRIPGPGNTRAIVYVRVDDNFDDDPDNPANNLPLADADGKVRVTLAAEYPVFVNGSGVEQSDLKAERGRARRVLSATFGTDAPVIPAIATNDDLSIPGNMTVCGGCGSVHSNQDMSIGGSPTICENATASGTLSGGGTVGGIRGGSRPVIPLPIISPYDDVLVPTTMTFETMSSGTVHLRCPATTAKYYAFVADGSKGKVYKAYWNSGQNRWNWLMIDDLNNGTNTQLDDCGRIVSGETSADTGAGAAINDTKNDEFYGFKQASTPINMVCNTCASGNGDDSLCTTANNDFVANGFYEWNSGTYRTGGSYPILPGNFNPDGQKDWNPETRIKDGIWDYSGDRLFSPLYGAVVFVLGGVKVSGNPGKVGSIDYCSSSGCSTSLPAGAWKLTLIAHADIDISGQMNAAPANAGRGYHLQFVAGRDLMISGNPQEDTAACGGGSCAAGVPGDIATIAGAFVAHEQIGISGNPNIFGFLIAEDAIQCSDKVTGANTINGNPQILYDCVHPPNPWATAAEVELLSWQELH